MAALIFVAGRETAAVLTVVGIVCRGMSVMWPDGHMGPHGPSRERRCALSGRIIVEIYIKKYFNKPIPARESKTSSVVIKKTNFPAGTSVKNPFYAGISCNDGTFSSMNYFA